jgi:hypothetical protein
MAFATAWLIALRSALVVIVLSFLDQMAGR